MTASKTQPVAGLIHRLRRDESGFVASAELALIITLMICAVAVGWSTVKDSLAQELNDISEAIGAVDQSYRVASHIAPAGEDGFHGESAPFGFVDELDACDCQPILVIAGVSRSDNGGNAGNGSENQ